MPACLEPNATNAGDEISAHAIPRRLSAEQLPTRRRRWPIRPPHPGSSAARVVRVANTIKEKRRGKGDIVDVVRAFGKPQRLLNCGRALR